MIIKHIHIVILYGIHVKVKLYYFLFYMVFNTMFLVYCNYSEPSHTHSLNRLLFTPNSVTGNDYSPFKILVISRNFILTCTYKSCKIFFVVRQAQLAQLVEQRTENPCVSGSIPELGIIQQIKYSYAGVVQW